MSQAPQLPRRPQATLFPLGRIPKQVAKHESPTRLSYENVFTDAFDWLAERRPDSIHAVVTDPPYGLVEYTAKELEKLRKGKGGIWRIPPSFDGCQRSPLPRFTVLKAADHDALRLFF